MPALEDTAADPIIANVRYKELILHEAAKEGTFGNKTHCT